MTFSTLGKSIMISYFVISSNIFSKIINRWSDRWATQDNKNLRSINENTGWCYKQISKHFEMSLKIFRTFIPLRIFFKIWHSTSIKVAFKFSVFMSFKFTHLWFFYHVSYITFHLFSFSFELHTEFKRYGTENIFLLNSA